jgi:hypothetical protein
MMMAPQSLRSALQAALGQMAQLLARHKQSAGLFASGLGPQGVPPFGPGNPCFGRCSMCASLRLLVAA